MGSVFVDYLETKQGCTALTDMALQLCTILNFIYKYLELAKPFLGGCAVQVHASLSWDGWEQNIQGGLTSSTCHNTSG